MLNITSILAGVLLVALGLTLLCAWAAGDLEDFLKELRELGEWIK